MTALIVAVLAEQHDDWAEGRRYFGLEVLAKSRLALIPSDDTITEKEGLTQPHSLPRVQPPDHAAARSSTTTVDLTWVPVGHPPTGRGTMGTPTPSSSDGRYWLGGGLCVLGAAFGIAAARSREHPSDR